MVSGRHNYSYVQLMGFINQHSHHWGCTILWGRTLQIRHFRILALPGARKTSQSWPTLPGKSKITKTCEDSFPLPFT